MTVQTEIAGVLAWEAFDSRGNPTVGCAVRLRSGHEGDATVPSGASTGRYEAHELRDGDGRFGGRGVRRAVSNVNEVIGPRVTGMAAGDQESLDAALRDLDGTDDLRRLGANAILAVSIAAARAAALAHGVPLYRWLNGDRPPLLPLPMVNVLSGGAHAGGAVDIQDVLVVPVAASSFSEAIEWSWRVRTAASQLAADRGHSATLVADEGGLGLPLESNEACLAMVVEAIDTAGLQPGTQVALAVDVAANQLQTTTGYSLATEGRTVDAATWVAELETWTTRFPIVSIEDPVADDDHDGWAEATAVLGERVQLLGDDLFATNLQRLEHGIEDHIANAVLVKPNQNGTLSGARQVLRTAQSAGYATVVSGRSGDTEDAWLADLAIGWNAGQIKIGSTTRSERTAKWNRLLRIEAEAASEVQFAGADALSSFASTIGEES